MLNPAIILVLLVALGAATLGGYRYGYSRAEDAVSARVAAAQVEAIEQANRDTEAATKRALDAARAEADARVRAAGIRRKGEIDATAKARPECVRDADSMRLLHEAIAAANGTAPAADSVPDAVRSNAAASVGQ